LGVGLLSATAVSLARIVADLTLYGADAVRTAFRMGIHVQAVSYQLEARSDVPETWAYVIHNVDPLDAQRELDAIHTAAPASATGRIFISAVSPTSVTISGPPSRLKGLFQKSKMFRDATSIALPVYGGLCHAPHIYGSRDTKAIVHDGATTLNTKLQTSSAAVMPLYSTSTGASYEVDSGVELFEAVVTELLTRPIEWDNVIAKVVSVAVEKFDAISNITLSCFGNSIPLRDLERALQDSLTDVSICINSYMSLLNEIAPRDTLPRGTAQAKLAIVGMSCRLPGGATDTEKFWQLLESGLDVSRQIPPDRFDLATHYDAEGKDMNKTMTQYGCFIDDPALFDAAFFNMSPREAMAVDPQMRLSLVTAYEALEKAGFVGNRTLSTKLQRIGTYYGQAADDYREVNQGQEVGTYYIPGGCRAFGPGRINYFFKFAGPSYSVDTACSSGLAAIEVCVDSRVMQHEAASGGSFLTTTAF
jgi:monodictyphenone polyketide synthase